MGLIMSNIEISINGRSIKGYFIRKDSKSAFFEVCSVDPWYVSLVNAGGGFPFKVPVKEFMNQYERAEAKPLKPFYTGFDEMPCMFRAYTGGVRWNGWAVPYFEKEQVLFLAQTPGLFGGLSYNPETDEVKVVIDEELTLDEVLIVKGEDVVTSDGVKHLYQLGLGYCWNFYDWDSSAKED